MQEKWKNPTPPQTWNEENTKENLQDEEPPSKKKVCREIERENQIGWWTQIDRERIKQQKQLERTLWISNRHREKEDEVREIERERSTKRLGQRQIEAERFMVKSQFKGKVCSLFHHWSEEAESSIGLWKVWFSIIHASTGLSASTSWKFCFCFGNLSIFCCSGESSGCANVERWLELVPFGPALQTPSAKNNYSGAPWMGCFLLLTGQPSMAQKWTRGNYLKKWLTQGNTKNNSHDNKPQMDSKLFAKSAQQFPIKGWIPLEPKPWVPKRLHVAPNYKICTI